MTIVSSLLLITGFPFTHLLVGISGYAQWDTIWNERALSYALSGLDASCSVVVAAEVFENVA